MRTVAFSDAGIVKLLGDKFVCAWVNRRPDLKFKDGLYPAGWKPRGLTNGTAVTNVTSVFASPDGMIVHAVPGYLDAVGFMKHAKFAQELHGKLAALKLEDRAKHYARAHTLAAMETKNYIERQSHVLLCGRFMCVDEMPLAFFDGLGNEFR